MKQNDYLSIHIRSFFEDHLVCQRNVSRNTIASYRDAIKLLLTFVSKSISKPVTTLLVTDIDCDVVLAFLVNLEEVRGNSIQTRNYRLAAIKRLFDYIAARDPLLLDHCRKVVTIPRKRGAALPETKYLERDQIAAILHAPNRKLKIGRRDHAILHFLYNTGARVQEVADVRIANLTLTAPYRVELLGKGRKWRTCPLWDSTVDNLERLLTKRLVEKDDFLFLNREGRPLTRSGIEGIVRRHVKTAAATVPALGTMNITPHTFRHTTAMHLLQSGVEINVIRSWLGHVSLTTTNRYVEIDLAMKTQALEHCRLTTEPANSPRWKTDENILTWLDSL